MRVFESRAVAVLYKFLKSNLNKNSGTVVVPANICPIVPITIISCGLNVEIVDIDCKTFSYDIEQLKYLITNSSLIRAVLLAKPYGAESNIDDIAQMIRRYRPEILLIKDNCLGIPITASKSVDCDLELYSTGYSKYVDLGRGGFGYIKDGLNYNPEYTTFYNPLDLELVTSEYKKCLNEQRQYHLTSNNWLNLEKFDLKPEIYDDLIEERIKNIRIHKEKINKIYSFNLPLEIQVNEEFNHWRFNIVIDNKDEVLKCIFANDLFASSHYQSVSNMFGGVATPIADLVNSKMVNLFNDFYITEEQAYAVVKIINQNL